MGVSAAVGMVAVSGLSNANAQRLSGKSQEQLANYNSEIDTLRADDALYRGTQAEVRLKQNTKRMIGSQRAAFAASGVDINDPDSTAANVFADTAAMSELDAVQIRSNAAREAWGYRVGAADDAFRGQIARMEGDNKAIGTIMSTAANVYTAKYGFGKGTS